MVSHLVEPLRAQNMAEALLPFCFFCYYVSLVCGGWFMTGSHLYNPSWPLPRGNLPASARPATVRVDRISALLTVTLGACVRTDIPAGFPGKLSLRCRLSSTVILTSRPRSLLGPSADSLALCKLAHSSCKGTRKVAFGAMWFL